MSVRTLGDRASKGQVRSLFGLKNSMWSDPGDDELVLILETRFLYKQSLS